MAPRGLRRADWSTAATAARARWRPLSRTSPGPTAPASHAGPNGACGLRRARTKLDLTPGSLRLNRPEARRAGPLAARSTSSSSSSCSARSASCCGSAWRSGARPGPGRGHRDRRRAGPHPRGRRGPRHHDHARLERRAVPLRPQVDGVPLLEDLEPEADGRSVRIRPADLVETELVEQALAEGEHKIELSVGRMFLGDSTFTWTLRRRQHRSRRSTCRPTSIPCRSPTR